MKCVKSTIKTEDTIKKSRFICILSPCETEKEALQHLEHQHRLHGNASHIAFAYRIKSNTGIIARHYDAGEPRGTAGKPIFQHLEGKDLVNLICIVVRYYGGIKLGTGGLTRAYGNTAKKTIEACPICELVIYSEKKLVLEYNQMQNFEYQIAKLNGIIVDQQFSKNINLLVKIPEKNLAALTTLFKL